MRLPSGDQRARSAASASLRGGPPSRGTVQMLWTLLLLATSGVLTAKATVFPSGDSCGSLIRWIFSMASASNGRFCARRKEGARARTSHAGLRIVEIIAHIGFLHYLLFGEEGKGLLSRLGGAGTRARQSY